MKRSEAIRLRSIVEQAAQSLPDNVAVTAKMFYPAWEDGAAYRVGEKVQRNGRLWRVVQAHTAVVGWEPENTASLWEQIDETHSGTDGGAVLCSGLQNLSVYSKHRYSGTSASERAGKSLCERNLIPCRNRHSNSFCCACCCIFSFSMIA